MTAVPWLTVRALKKEDRGRDLTLGRERDQGQEIEEGLQVEIEEGNHIQENEEGNHHQETNNTHIIIIKEMFKEERSLQIDDLDQRVIVEKEEETEQSLLKIRRMKETIDKEDHAQDQQSTENNKMIG